MASKTVTTPEVEIIQSSSNVFADIELPDSDERLAKAELAYIIGRTLQERSLPPSQAALILGLDEDKISAICRGNLKSFSIGLLLECLRSLGQDVEIVIHHQEPTEHEEPPGRWMVAVG